MLDKEESTWDIGLVLELMVWQLRAEGSNRPQKKHKESEKGSN